MEKKNTWETYNAKQLKELENINKDNKEFIENSKT